MESRDRQELIAALSSRVGDDGTGDLGVIVDTELARNPAPIRVDDLVDLVTEAREEWAAERAHQRRQR